MISLAAVAVFLCRGVGRGGGGGTAAGDVASEDAEVLALLCGPHRGEQVVCVRAGTPAALWAL